MPVEGGGGGTESGETVCSLLLILTLPPLPIFLHYKSTLLDTVSWITGRKRSVTIVFAIRIVQQAMQSPRVRQKQKNDRSQFQVGTRS